MSSKPPCFTVRSGPHSQTLIGETLSAKVNLGVVVLDLFVRDLAEITYGEIDRHDISFAQRSKTVTRS